MTSLKGRRLAAVLMLLLACAAPCLSGCGGSVPETGTVVTPVNEDEAKQQNEAMRNYYGAQGKAGATAKAP